MTSTFADSAGNRWTIRLNAGLIARVKREADVDLEAALASGEAIMRLLFGSPMAWGAMLYVLCQDEARGRDITPEQFAYLLDGPTIERSGEALLAACADFFRRSSMSTAIREDLPQVLAMIDRMVLAEYRSRVASLLNAGNSPDSPESMPNPGPSAN